MPKVSSSSHLQRYTYTITLILLTGIIIGPYLRCSKKGLVCVAIATPSSRQPSSYLEYTKSNIRLGYNIRSISNSKYTRSITLNSL